MLLNVYCGAENWHNHSAKMHVFFHPIDSGVVDPRDARKELHIGLASKDPTFGIRRVGNQTIINAHRIRSAHLAGEWTSSSYEVPEQAVFKVFAHKTSGFGTMQKFGNLFIQMRPEAALRRTEMALSGSPDASLQAVYVEGRFDILSLDEAVAAGVVVWPQFRRHSDPSMLSKVFSTRILEAQVRARSIPRRVEVQSDTGETVTVVMRRRTRAMGL